jgi:RNA polymerase sigma-70 factor (ECF subfamily)
MSLVSQLSDEARLLIERWKSGDQAAAEAIYQRYARRLSALAATHMSQRLARRVGPDDIVQSVFRTFFRRSRDGQFEIDHSNSLWRLLVRITLNKIRSKVEHHHAGRRDVSMEVSPARDEFGPEAMAHDPTPAEAAALNDEIEALLVGLEPPEPEILRLCFQGYSASEIAAQVGCSRWTVRRVLDRIGHRLERRLRPD